MSVFHISFFPRHRKSLNGKSKQRSMLSLTPKSPVASLINGSCVPANATEMKTTVSRIEAESEARPGASHQLPLRKRLKMEISNNCPKRNAKLEANAMRRFIQLNARRTATENPTYTTCLALCGP